MPGHFKIILLLILILALIVRFIYFPNNIYFGYDQARDAFATRQILKGHLKLIGPPTTFEGLRHGVLYYYIYAPFYALGRGDPQIVAAFLRVFNATGVLLIFILSSILFNKYVAILSAFLFAMSFEQTQFALYFNHPSLAVISILIMFLGLAILIFQKKPQGLILAFVGLGLSIQFEFLLSYLTVPFLLCLITFRRSLPKISQKTIILSMAIFILIITTFLIAEIKYNFRTVHALSQLFFRSSTQVSPNTVYTYLFEMRQMIKFNLVASSSFAQTSSIALFVLFVALALFDKRKQIIFLGIWFFSGLVIYLVNGGADFSNQVLQYHPNVGLSLSLMTFAAYLLYLLGKKTHFLITLIILIVVTWGNLSLIKTINPFGSMPEINAQSLMLLSDEKKVLDEIYHEANGEKFAVKAITLPFYVNTTWSYLFEWYGKQRYGYLPVWGGKNALGYFGNLVLETAQDKLPNKRFLIIEPSRGIPSYLIDDYLREESYFTDIIKDQQIGQFRVQIRQRK